jgi:membrane-associated protein
MFAAIVDIPANVGYSVVFALIAVETMGIPVPGETALIAAALLAHDGEMDIVPLIALAAAAAIIGDNVGFAIGRKAGRRLFVMPGPLLHHRLTALEVGEPFFKRHGPKAVFLGRWVAGLRIASAWLAGMNKMDWPTFLFWNALGGIAWATSIALGVYFVGHAFEKVLGVGGIVAAAVVSGALVGLFVLKSVRSRRSGEPDVPEPEREPEHAHGGH